MVEEIKLTVNFISGSQGGGTGTGGLASTGDVFSCLWIACIVLLFALGIAGYFLYRNRQVINVRTSRKNSSSAISISHHLPAVMLALSALLLFACLSFVSNAFANAKGSLEPDTNTITATVNDDGSVDFSTCVLTNKSDAPYTLASANVAITSEAQSVSAINNTKLTINGFDGVIYDSIPDGQDHDVTDIDVLAPTESTELSFYIDNLDKDSCLALVGKPVYTISLTSTEITYVDKPEAETDLVYDGSSLLGVMANDAYTLAWDEEGGLEPSIDADGAKGQNAGTYGVVASLNEGYLWTGGDRDPVYLTFTIDKAQSTISFDPIELSFGTAYSDEDRAMMVDEAESTHGEVSYHLTTHTDNFHFDRDEEGYLVLVCKGKTPIGEYELVAYAQDSGDENYYGGDTSSEPWTPTWTVSPNKFTVTFENVEGGAIFDAKTGGQKVESIPDVPVGSVAEVDKEDHTRININDVGYYAVADPGYEFVDFGEFPLFVNRDITITPSFKQQAFTVTASVATGQDEWGSVYPTSIADVPYGTPVTYSDDKKIVIIGDTAKPYGNIIATPSDATAQYTFDFDGWTDEVETITADTNFEANFSRTVNTYTVTASVASGQSEWGKVEPTSYTEVPYGTTIFYNNNVATVTDFGSITATPAEETEQYTYAFDEWSQNPTTVTGDTTIEASFTQTIKKFTVTATVASGQSEWGKVEPASYTEVPYGTTITYNGNVATITGYGTITAAPAEETEQYTYAFDHWTSEASSVVGNTNLEANFTQTLRTYNVTASVASSSSGFGTVDLDPDTITAPYGAVISYSADKTVATIKDATSNETYGTIKAIPSSETAQYTYAFDNWTSEISSVVENTNLEANFTRTLRTYSVTASVASSSTGFGTVDLDPDTITAPYGAVISYSADKKTVTIADAVSNTTYGTITATPTTETAQYTYAFDNWTSEISSVVENTNLEANFTRTLRTYSVTASVASSSTGFGTVELNPTEIIAPYGAVISYSADKTVATIKDSTSNETYGKITAIPAEETDQYTYAFDQWTSETSSVIDNTNLEANFTRTLKIYNVTASVASSSSGFGTVDLDPDTITAPYGAVISYSADKTVATIKDATSNETYGKITATPAEETDQYTYAFDHWTSETSSVVGNTNLEANFTQTLRTYNVTASVASGQTGWGTVVLDPTTITAPYGAEISYSADKTVATIKDATSNETYGKITATPAEQTDQYTYAFDHWTSETSSVVRNTNLEANFTKTLRTYNVTASVASGQTGWGTVVLDPTTITAPYGAEISYSADKTVATIKDATSNETYGKITATPAEETDQYTYAFDHWTSETSSVVGNTNLEANFKQTLREYNVTASVASSSSGFGTVDLEPDTITAPYGAVISYSADKTVATIKDATSNETYGTITATSAEQTDQYTYAFDHWTSETSSVVGNTNLEANFKQTLREYNVTASVASSSSGFGTVDLEPDTITAPYGAVISYSADKTVATIKDATSNETYGTITATSAEQTDQYTYAFDHWTSETSSVVGNTNLEANFTRTLRTYTVSFENVEGGAVYTAKTGGTKVEEIENVPYGSDVAVDASDTTKITINNVSYYAVAEEGYTFISFGTVPAKITQTTTITPVFEEVVLHSLEIGGFHYYPVFKEHMQGIHFYDGNDTSKEITYESMRDLTGKKDNLYYAIDSSASEGASIYLVRDGVGESWDSAFGSEIVGDATDYLGLNMILGEDCETLKFNYTSGQTDPLEVNDVSLIDVNEAYNLYDGYSLGFWTNRAVSSSDAEIFWCGSGYSGYSNIARTNSEPAILFSRSVNGGPEFYNLKFADQSFEAEMPTVQPTTLSFETAACVPTASLTYTANDLPTGWSIDFENKVITIPQFASTKTYNFSVTAKAAADGDYKETSVTANFLVTVTPLKTAKAVFYNSTSDEMNAVAGDLIFYYDSKTVDEYKAMAGVANAWQVTNGVYTEKVSSETTGIPPWMADDYCTNIKRVSFDEKFHDYTGITKTSYWFGVDHNTDQISPKCACCDKLTDIDVSNLNFAAVDKAVKMFTFAGHTQAGEWKAYGFDTWDTSSLTDIQQMFCHAGRNSNKLSISGLENWNTSSISVMQAAFRDLSGNATSPEPIVLHLDNWNLSGLANMNAMFRSSWAIQTIYVGKDWTVPGGASGDNVFVMDYITSGASPKIVGGNNTAWNSGKINKTYATADRTETEGYLTDIRQTKDYINKFADECYNTMKEKINLDTTYSIRSFANSGLCIDYTVSSDGVTVFNIGGGSSPGTKASTNQKFKFTTGIIEGNPDCFYINSADSRCSSIPRLSSNIGGKDVVHPDNIWHAANHTDATGPNTKWIFQFLGDMGDGKVMVRLISSNNAMLALNPFYDEKGEPIYTQYSVLGDTKEYWVLTPEDPATADNVAEEKIVEKEDTVIDEPVVDDPVIDEPVIEEEPVVEEPVIEEEVIDPTDPLAAIVKFLKVDKVFEFWP